MLHNPSYTVYEFFAGGGMARCGLGESWECLIANDNNPKKAESYAANWGGDRFILDDIANLNSSQLPDVADLAWASFPCQDLSQAGREAGLNGQRSGTFWAFAGLMQDLAIEGRHPRLIVLENVQRLLSSNDGSDFAAVVGALNSIGYRIGALIIDAVRFVPQSRPRVFVIAARTGVKVPPGIVKDAPSPTWHNRALVRAVEKLPPADRFSWFWLSPPIPAFAPPPLFSLLEDEPISTFWDSPNTTQRLINLMDDNNQEKVNQARLSNRVMHGMVFKRTRLNQQRAEIRFDVAGCLRTPSGGSSRQILMEIKGESTRSRLLSPRETARLMGLPDTYKLPDRPNDAYHLTGDGVAVPVVSFLGSAILEPILDETNYANRLEVA